MRKALPLLAILASSVFFLAATPSPASAANCTVAAGATQIDTSHQPPYGIYYGANFTGCTGVSGVRVYMWQGTVPTGWWDISCGCWAEGQNGWFTGSYTDWTLLGTFSTYSNTRSQAFWWYGACRYIRPTFWYQIRNSNGNTWGSIYQYTTGFVSQICN